MGTMSCSLIVLWTMSCSLIVLPTNVLHHPLQDGVWFCLGHAASKMGDYDLSVKALQHCVSIEPDVSEH